MATNNDVNHLSPIKIGCTYYVHNAITGKIVESELFNKVGNKELLDFLLFTKTNKTTGNGK